MFASGPLLIWASSLFGANKQGRSTPCRQGFDAYPTQSLVNCPIWSTEQVCGLIVVQWRMQLGQSAAPTVDFFHADRQGPGPLMNGHGFPARPDSQADRVLAHRWSTGRQL